MDSCRSSERSFSTTDEHVISRIYGTATPIRHSGDKILENIDNGSTSTSLVNTDGDV